MSRLVYLDNHATTAVDPRVVEAMLPYFTEKYGNAASRSHPFGWAAEEGCEAARKQVAALIGARPKEIVFTSGATESNNLAVKGVIDFHAGRGRHLVTAATEHKSVLDACKRLEKKGLAEVTYLAVERDGTLDPARVREAIRPDTVLVSVMAANNEIGTIHPLREIGRIARERGVLFHTDATQAAGRMPIDVEADCIDLLSLSAHKIYGPKGCGALYVRSREPLVRLSPLLDGGGHERGLRSGTLNVPGIVGLGKACELAAAEMAVENQRLRALRERLHAALTEQLDEVRLNGHPTQRLAGNLNLTIAHVEADSLMMALREIALSSGSACTSTTLEPSHVLRAIGLNEDEAHGSIRFGIGRFNTEEEIDFTIARVVAEVRRLREMSIGYRKRRVSRAAAG